MKKRIAGFTAALFLVLSIAATSFAHDSMMKQDSTMMTKKTMMEKHRMMSKHHRRYHKGKMMTKSMMK